jgi:hypothetical protein
MKSPLWLSPMPQKLEGHSARVPLTKSFTKLHEAGSLSNIFNLYWDMPNSNAGEDTGIFYLKLFMACVTA